ncbi:MAG: 2-C-methyl-D-erythritol 2,4-cyclodiphosphate synthase [gamma proteobacterium endosymbiont of Lamellibrachia anaximandri]|nr:2-C-methyl-D-erythritol 2,4-cyclodiphosphate synthase [gamma proteobacterium endosymbiont of Lamellibrachia anaximandri]MBL3533498.1 2-C-methyl-D-erythritol 2,4-cyclodiphosphate synthase [gamma proteobacterium endosymbiont of Lamellibrachia anaximandri]
MMRIGQGYDAHRFESGKRLLLGGVEIKHDQGLKAHSDGDVLIHALCDALLGAAGMGDIGRHFPDSASEYAGIDSRRLLQRVVELIQDAGLRVGNVDLTAVAQRPKLAPYIDNMQARLASDLQVEPARVNVKATTTEGMGFTGRGEGIAAYAIVLLEEGSA